MQEKPVRACITGIGAITPFATGWADVAGKLQQGEVQYAPWSSELEPPFEGARLGIVKEYPKERYFTERQLRLMDKAMSLNAAAAAFALEDSGLLVDGAVTDCNEVATILSSAQGEAASLYRFGSPIFQQKPAGVNPAHFPMIARNVACGQIAVRFGLRGWSTMIASGDPSGAHAFARAVELVTSGRTHTVLVGAYEVLSQLGLHQWRLRHARRPSDSMALDPALTDWVPVEGACYFVIESEEHAARRARRPYAFVTQASHGYSQGARGQGWSTLIDRFVSRGAQIPGQRRSMHVSCLSETDGDGLHADNARRFTATLNELCPSDALLKTRPLFGDARSVNPMYGVALAAQGLADGAAGRGALVSSITSRGAYSLFSLQSH